MLQHALSAGSASLSERNQQRLQNSVGALIQHAQKRGLRGAGRRRHPHHHHLQQQQQQSETTTTANSSNRQLEDEPHNNQEEQEAKPHRLTPKKTADVITPPRHTQRIALRLQPHDVTSLPDALLLWFQSTQELCASRELRAVVGASVGVAQQAGMLAVHTATLPARCTWHCTTAVLTASTHLVVSSVATLLPSLTNEEHQASGEGSEEHHEHHGGNHGLLHNVLSLPGAILGLAGQVVVSVAVAPVWLLQHHAEDHKDKESSVKQNKKEEEESAACRRYYSPPPSRNKKEQPKQVITPSSSSSSMSPRYDGDDDVFLDRLRLDYVPKDGEGAFKAAKKELFPAPVVEKSRFLLRVNDLCLVRASCSSSEENHSGHQQRIYYIDLSSKQMDEELVSEAFDQLCSTAFCMLANHLLVRVHDPAYETTPQSEIRWQAEGSTKRILRRMAEQSEPDRVQTLCNETCIWSGRFVQRAEGYGRHHGFFLARGAIRMSARALLDLLWNDKRTGEYNNFCLGRTTLQSIHGGDDETVLQCDGGNVKAAAKIIRSKMRVPFAGITVKAVCLMHVRPLSSEEGDGGYVILSRTLDTGATGTHYDETGIDDSGRNNEILWGCNIIRPLQDGVSDLTTLSQVGSNVPNFLAQKIGMMGIADFFKNVRAIADANN